MSRFTRIAHTCSMTELGIFSGERFSLEKIKKFLNSKTEPSYMSTLPPLRQRKAVICNTCYHQNALKKLGFKEVATYKGNDGIVHVMLYIQPRCRIVKRRRK